MTSRYCPELELPRYAFVPGLNEHPHKSDDAHLPSLVYTPVKNWQEWRPYLYAVDCFNLSYFWETHEVLESCWNTVGRKTKMGFFLQGIIFLAAGRLKYEMGQSAPGDGHYQRALDLLTPILKVNGRYFGLSYENVKGITSNTSILITLDFRP